MMKKLVMLMLVLCPFALAAENALANALANPGFETDPTGTTPGDWAKFDSGFGGLSVHSTAMPRSGTGHMDLSVTGENLFAGVFQDLGIVINPGDKVTFTGWNKSLVDPFNGTRELKIEWHGAPQFRVDSLGPIIGTEYEPFSIEDVAPAGTTGVTVTYALSSFFPGAGPAQVFLDDFDVSIMRIPEPSTVLLGGLALMGMVCGRRRVK